MDGGDRDRRDEMHRGRRDDDCGHDYHEDRERRRPDAKDQMPGWGGGQREERDRRGDDDWAYRLWPGFFKIRKKNHRQRP